LGKETDIGKLGDKKSVQEFEKYMGIDFKKGTMSVLAQCGISGYDTNDDLVIKYGLKDLQSVLRHCKITREKQRPLITF